MKTLVVLAVIGGIVLLVRGCMEYTTRDYSAACLVTGRKHDRGSDSDLRYLQTRECGDLDVKPGSNTGWKGVEVGHRYQFRLRFYDRRHLPDYVEIRAVTDLEGHPVPHTP